MEYWRRLVMMSLCMVYIEFQLLVSILAETPVGEFPPLRLLSLGGWGQWFPWIDGNLSPVKTATRSHIYLPPKDVPNVLKCSSFAACIRT